MSHICPLCSHTVGTYAEIDKCKTLIGGVISIRFWLCHRCSQATTVQPTILDNLSHEEFSRLAEYFKQERKYTLRNPRRREIVQESTLVGTSHV